MLQVATFFRCNISYEKQPAFCILLNKVPGLSFNSKCNIRNYLQHNKKYGKHNNPRPFSKQELADKGIVSLPIIKN